MKSFRKVLFFLIFNIFLIIIFNVAFSVPSVTKVFMKDVKKSDYDVIILGHSHAETSLDPFVMSKMLNEKTYNLAERSQPVGNLLYILQEANINKNVNKVILELSPIYWTLDGISYCFSGDVRQFYNLTGIRRWDYFYNFLIDNSVVDVISHYYITPKVLKNTPNNLKAKLNIPYIKSSLESVETTLPLYTNEGIYKHNGRGFLYGISSLNIGYMMMEFDNVNITKKNLDYFEKIYNYCKKNDIELICFISAVPPIQKRSESIKYFHNYFLNLCNKYNIAFYDMNYVKTDFFNPNNKDFMDSDGHMLGKTTQKYSEVFCDILNSDDKDKFFYKSYEEIQNNLQKR